MAAGGLPFTTLNAVARVNRPVGSPPNRFLEQSAFASEAPTSSGSASTREKREPVKSCLHRSPKGESHGFILATDVSSPHALNLANFYYKAIKGRPIQQYFAGIYVRETTQFDADTSESGWLGESLPGVTLSGCPLGR